MEGSSTWPPANVSDRTSEADTGYQDPTASEPPRRRRWPWIVSIVVLIGLLAATGAVAWDQREVAATWQERAEALEEQRDDALGRGEALQTQLEDVAALLASSEGDVGRLEERIRDLADEKAQAEDTATTVQVERDVLAGVSTQIADAVEALDTCVTRLFDLQSATVRVFNETAPGEPVDVAPLNEQASSTTDFCNDARGSAAAAAAAAEGIPR